MSIEAFKFWFIVIAVVGGILLTLLLAIPKHFRYEEAPLTVTFALIVLAFGFIYFRGFLGHPGNPAYFMGHLLTLVVFRLFIVGVLYVVFGMLAHYLVATPLDNRYAAKQAEAKKARAKAAERAAAERRRADAEMRDC
jgi:hypothetical protein